MLFVALGLLSRPAKAWGPVGHEVIAFIAEDHLNDAARAKIAALLGPEVRLASVANWADEVRPHRPKTAAWHYLNLPPREALTESDEVKFCKGQSCVVGQVQADLDLLGKPTTTRTQKLEALEYLVHFVGDLHQPLHCADDTDRGGNQKIVHFISPGSRSKKGAKITLHALWDHLIEIRTGENPRELATTLETRITPALAADWSKGTPADWAWQSYGIARDTVYGGLTAGPSDVEGVTLPVTYYTTMRKVVDTQLERAGVRLAILLNRVFGQ